jgi:hypothetical protein
MQVGVEGIENLFMTTMVKKCINLNMTHVPKKNLSIPLYLRIG